MSQQRGGRPGRRAVLAGTTGAALAAGLGTPDAASAAAGTTQSHGSAIWRTEDVALLLIDYQPEMFAGQHSSDPKLVELKARFLARAARALDVPIVWTEVGVDVGINHPTIPTLRAELPGLVPIGRSSMDAWEDPDFRRAVRATKRTKLVIGGMYSEICVAFPTIHALDDGLEVAFIADAIAGQTTVAHETAITRMTHAGATASTAMAMVLEWFRDWAGPAAAKVTPVLQWHDEQLSKLHPQG